MCQRFYKVKLKIKESEKKYLEKPSTALIQNSAM
ncbi:hypothetical protein T07_12774 [Trichinella nelsoni]|uniref:Uncharacterized protein n=1 Tax=Trichinella nelsoni TaxID=6336 RepID=A0A0V0RC60_9BILA|nr:hypothetical protein T07_12774 [Trichinella nelsoni]